jgi:hypothetical protein
VLPFVIVLVVLAVAMLAITQPLRRSRSTSPSDGDDAGPSATVAELRAARETKYAEIREAELDHQMGKLGDHDFEAVDRALRAEAIEILAALDAAGEPASEAPPVRAAKSPSTIPPR